MFRHLALLFATEGESPLGRALLPSIRTEGKPLSGARVCRAGALRVRGTDGSERWHFMAATGGHG